VKKEAFVVVPSVSPEWCRVITKKTKKQHFLKKKWFKTKNGGVKTILGI
jgi:hypothetical protein